MLEQFGIALFGVTAIFLSQDASPARRRYACLFGLCGQPFWFMAAWQSEQWGVLILCVLYTWAWARGVKTQWLNR